MTNTHRTIRRAALRLMTLAFVRNLLIAATLAAGGVVLMRIAERLFMVTFDWGMAWAVAGGAALVVAVVWTWLTRHDDVGIAREVDEAGGLRESLSTALCVEGQTDAWSRAAVEHAENASRRVVISQLFPFRIPDWSYVPLIAVALFFALGLVPRQGFFSGIEGVKPIDEQQAEVQQAKAEVEEVKDQVKDALSDIRDEELARQLEELMLPEEGGEPDEIRREAVKNLTSLQDRLSELTDGEDSAELEEIKARLSQLKTTEGAPAELNALTKALQKGDFKEAREALQDLADKLSEGELSEEQKKALEEALKKLAEELEQLAQDQQKLADQLKQMGLDPKLADNPEALEKAMQQANIPPQMQQQVMKQCKACKNAAQACQQMAGACQKAGQGMQGEQGMQGLSDLAQMMNGLSAKQQDQQSAEAAMQALSQQLKQMGDCMGQCQGSGMMLAQKFQMSSNGRGKGADAESSQAADFALNKEKAQGKDHGGPIVGSVMVEGDQVRGEAKQQFAETVSIAQQQAADAIETMQIPREYHDLVKKYYGRLDAQAKAEQSEAPAPKAE